MKALICSVLVFAASLAAVAQTPQSQTSAPKTQKKTDTGVTISTRPGPRAAVPTACTLTLSPNPVTNGGNFSFSVSYSPCLSVAQTEIFTFPWASNLASFTEATVRTKIFKTSGGCITSSFDNTIAPTALAIKGTFTADVVVRDTATQALICTATAPMTVN